MRKKTHKIELSEQEYDIIESGRNYRRSRPNGDPEILYYIERLFEEWLHGEDE